MRLNFHLGGALVFAGTSVGASMVALPIVCYKLGFLYSIFLMLAMALLMTTAAFIVTDVCIEKKHVASISGLSRRYFSMHGYLAVTICQSLLFFSLLSAYLTGMGQIITHALDVRDLHISQPIITFFILLLFGLFLLTHTKISDYTNRLLFIIKIIIFCIIASIMLGKMNTSYITSEVLTLSKISSSLSVVFTGFGFHGSIPMVIKYIGQDDKQKIKNTIVVGVVISFVIYTIWLAAAFGILPPHGKFSFDAITQSQEDNIGLFTLFLVKAVDMGFISYAITVFTFLAIATSFFGVALGLFDIVQGHTKSWNFEFSRRTNLFITLTPPLLLSFFYPEGFIIALEFAAITLSVIAVVMPSLIMIRKTHERIYYLPLALGIGIIINEIINKLS